MPSIRLFLSLASTGLKFLPYAVCAPALVHGPEIAEPASRSQHGISQAPLLQREGQIRRHDRVGGKAALKGSGRRTRGSRTYGPGPNSTRPQAKREAVTVLMNERHLRFTRACGLVGVSRSLYRYQSRRPDTGILRSRIGKIAAEKRRYGYRRIHVLLKREGFTMNVKRTYRLYREAGLAAHRHKRKRIGLMEHKPLPKTVQAGHTGKHTTAVRQSRIVKPRRGRCGAHRTGGAISPGWRPSPLHFYRLFRVPCRSR